MLHKFIAFQKSKELYRRCKLLRLPRHLHDQLMKASSSVALNLAEGSGKRTIPEQKRFYSIALGSIRECAAIIELEEVKDPSLKALLDELGAMVYTLSRKSYNCTGTVTDTDSVTSN